MCRRNQLLGFGMLAFGLGLLVGCRVESGFFCSCWGIILTVLGVIWLQKKVA